MEVGDCEEVDHWTGRSRESSKVENWKWTEQATEPRSSSIQPSTTTQSGRRSLTKDTEYCKGRT